MGAILIIWVIKFTQNESFQLIGGGYTTIRARFHLTGRVLSPFSWIKTLAFTVYSITPRIQSALYLSVNSVTHVETVASRDWRLILKSQLYFLCCRGSFTHFNKPPSRVFKTGPAALPCGDRTLTNEKASINATDQVTDGLHILSKGHVSASWFNFNMNKNLWLPGRWEINLKHTVWFGNCQQLGEV